jgi:hypothetical protein
MFIPDRILRSPEDDAGSAPLDTGADTSADASLEAAPAAAPDASHESAEEAVKAALGSMAPEPAPEAKPAPAAAPEAKSPVPGEAPPADSQRAPLDDLTQIPRGLSGEARARYKALGDHARQLNEQLSERSKDYEAVAQRINTYESVLRDAGATPEVLSGHLNYIKAINSGDLEGALSFIENERAALARAIGKPIEGVDLLADFPDLRQRVDGFELTEQDALEMAKLRRGQQQLDAQRQSQQQQEQQRQQMDAYSAERASALSEIKAWTESQQSSIDWDVMEGAVVTFLQQPATQQILAQTPPKNWLNFIKSHYASVQQLAARSVQAPRTGVTPLRPRGAGGTVTSQASSSEDAVRQRLGY